MKIRTFAKLGDICDVSAGQGAPQGDSNYCDNGTPFVKAGNLIELIQGKKETEIQKVSEDVAKKHKLKKYPVGSLLFAKSGMSCMKGYVYQLKNDSYVVSHLAIVKPKKDSSDYIEYCLRHIKPNSLVKDEAYPSISLQDISNLEIPLPSLEEQVKIADQLSKCTQIINKHKEQLEKYDFLIKSRFIEMFGDPVQNPMRWEKTELGNLCKEVRYGTSKPASENGKYTYLRMNNITYEGELDLTNIKSIDISDDELPKCSVKKGDILFNRTNSIELCGKTCLYKLDETMVIAGYIIRVRVNEKLNPQYVSTFFNTKSIKKMLKEMAKGAVNQANINAQEMQSIQIPVPPISLQNEYESFVQQIDKSKFEYTNTGAAA